MTKKIKVFGLFFCILAGQFSYGQTDKEKALSKAKEAIKLMDNGKIEESIHLLQESQQLDPERFDYIYEMAYAYHLKKDYKEVIAILEKNKSHKDATERCFQLLGNTYDMLGESRKAIEIYDSGLIKFPNSGMIYLEKGNVHWNKNQMDTALFFYETGIEKDPKFSSNYYRATLIYCNSTEEVWGMIYGEIFMNLERSSSRTAEISKLLFDTYKSEIKITGRNSMSVSFCQRMVINVNTVIDTNNFKLPFCMIYEPTLILAASSEKSIDINSLDRIRQAFIESYFERGHSKTHPNILFEYQDRIRKAGHFEAYNHWILMKGDEKKFDKWKSKNEQKFDDFLKWFAENKLKPDNANKFFMRQY